MSTEALLAHTLEEGQAAIEGLAPNALRIAEIMNAKFPKKALSAVASEMAPGVAAAKTATNPTCTALGDLVREEAAIAVASFRAAEMWLRLKTPSVSDGNNFGVDVQNYVISELQAMCKVMEAFVAAGRDYHWSRAQGVDKLFGDSAENSTSTSEDSETKEEDGKPKTTSTKKASKSSSTKESKPNGFPDYNAYLVGIDVKQYHVAYTSLTDIKNNYLKAHMLFTKNMKRLADPRGEGEDGRAVHAMSMF